jgi:hypothetical protein
MRSDEGKPTCLRCRQSGHLCEGYVRSDFINENVRFDSSLRAKAPSRPRQHRSLSYASPSLSAMHDDVCILHLRNTLFVTDPLDNLPPWLGFQALDSALNLSQQCLKALARTNFGQVQGAESIRKGGLQLYVHCLFLLNQELSDSDHKMCNDKLMATWILTAYEVNAVVDSSESNPNV